MGIHLFNRTTLLDFANAVGLNTSHSDDEAVFSGRLWCSKMYLAFKPAFSQCKFTGKCIFQPLCITWCCNDMVWAKNWLKARNWGPGGHSLLPYLPCCTTMNETVWMSGGNKQTKKCNTSSGACFSFFFFKTQDGGVVLHLICYHTVYQYRTLLSKHECSCLSGEKFVWWRKSKIDVNFFSVCLLLAICLYHIATSSVSSCG